MKTPIICTTAFALAFAFAPVSAGAADEQVEAKPAKEKKICRNYKVTGSLTRTQRICRTDAEWKEADGSTYQGVSKLQSGAAGGTAVTNNPGAGG